MASSSRTSREQAPCFQFAPKVNSDIGRRAYELYEERGSEQGHDVDDDWLQAERELGDALNSTGA